jgi:glycerol-1-phosphate dehydrogenase [NAD(P)+]
MDGYASTGAAMITGGMKVTYSAGLPLAIIADVDVLKDAPFEMIKSGYGDIIGKYSSLNDWKLSNLVNGEYFCQYIYDVTYQMIEKTIALADGLVKRDENSIKVLMEALTVVGIMMSFALTSRPASGSEHHLSHFFEIVGIVKDQEYFPHGIDVAYSTIETALVREKLLKQDFNVKNYRDDQQVLKAKLQQVYGQSVGEGCFKLHEKLGTYDKSRAQIYVDNQSKIKEILAEMPSAEQVEQILAKVGYDKKEFYALYGEQKIKQAIVYAKDIKDRYSVLWLNYDLNGEN